MNLDKQLLRGVLMIQSHTIKNLSRILLSILLVAYFCFVQGGVAVVYSAGATITYGSMTVFGHPSDVGTQTTTSVPSGGMGNVPATPVSGSAGSSGTQSVYNGPLTATTSTSTPSSISTPTSITSLQQYTTTTTTSTTLKTHDPTEKLLRPVYFNALSEEQPFFPQAEPYVVTVCLSYNDVTASGCLDKETPSQASEKLATMILNKYLKGIEIRPFRIVMPSSVPSAQQIQLLRKIETEAIAITEAKMLKDVKNSKMFLTATEEGRRQKQNDIIENAKIARQEVDRGINWSHGCKGDRASHDFHTGKSFRQLDSIAISER
jgi:hypothetical protein